MGPDFRPFFDQGHFQLLVFLLGQLHQFNGARQTGRTTADKQHIKIDTFTFYGHRCYSYSSKLFVYLIYSKYFKICCQNCEG